MKRLPNVPRKEEEIEMFSQILIDCTEDTTNENLSKNIETLKQLLSSYKDLKHEQDKAYRRYQRITGDKDKVLDQLTKFLRDTRKLLQKLDEESSGKIAPLVNFRDRSKLLPGTPRNLEGEILDRGVIKLSWQRPKRKDGGIISHYEVLMKNESNFDAEDDFQIVATSEASILEVILKNQPSDEKLSFKVVSRNHLGVSKNSSNVISLIL